MKTLFGEDNTGSWEEEWTGMPEYNNIKMNEPAITVTFKFKDEADFLKFKEIIKDSLFDGGKPFDGMQRKDKKSTWYPPRPKASKYLYQDEA